MSPAWFWASNALQQGLSKEKRDWVLSCKYLGKFYTSPGCIKDSMNQNLGELSLRNIHFVKLQKRFMYTGKVANLCPAFLVPESGALRLHKRSVFLPPSLTSDLNVGVSVWQPSLLEVQVRMPTRYQTSQAVQMKDSPTPHSHGVPFVFWLRKIPKG